MALQAERLQVLARRIVSDYRVGFAAVTALFLLMLRGLERIKARYGGDVAGIGLLEAGVVALYAVAVIGFAYMALRRRR